MKNLLYFCVFHNRDYLKLVNILLSSLRLFDSNKNMDILVLTSLDFRGYLLNLSDTIGIKLNFKFFEFSNMQSSAIARLYIYNYENINNYDKILYIDSDIIVQNDLTTLFNEDIEK